MPNDFTNYFNTGVVINFILTSLIKNFILLCSKLF